MDPIYKRVLDFIGDGVYRYTFEEGTILFANLGFVKILDLDCEPEDLIGKKINDVLNPFKEEGILAKIGQSPNNKTEGVEYYFKTAKGQEKWVVHHSFIVQDPLTQKKIVEAVLKDITQRKTAEENGLQSSQEWQQTFDASQDMIMLLDQDSKILKANTATSRFVNLPMEKIIGRHCFKVIHGMNEFCANCPQAKMWKTKKHEEAELYIKERDVWISITLDPILDVHNNIVKIVHTARDITKSKKTQEFLTKEEERFRLLYEQSPMGYQSLDENGCFLEINQAWTDTLGYARSEVIGHWFGEFLSPRYVEAFRERFPRFKEAGEVHNEFEMRHKNGSFKIIAFDGKIGRDANGHFKQTHCTLRDITEQKKAEEALRVSEEKFSKAFQNSPNIIIITSLPDGKIIEVNESILRVAEYERKEILGKTTTELSFWTIPSDRGRFLWELEQHGKVLEFETSFRKKSGKLFPALISGETIKIQGRPHILSVVYDITDQKEREKEEKALSEERKKIIESLADGIIIFDPAGKAIEINPAYEKLTGLTRSEIIGRHGTELALKTVKSTETKKIIDLFNKTIQGQAVFYCETTLIHKNGLEIPIFFTASFVKNPEGTPLLMIVSINDLSEQRKSHKALMEKESMLQTMSNNLSSAMLYQVMRKNDGSRVFTYLSNMVHNFYGITPEQGMTDANLIYNRVHKEDRKRIYEEEEKAHRTLSVFRTEARMINPSGDIRWSSFVSTPKKREDGTTIWDGIEFDISEIKKTEGALRKAEERFRDIAYSTADWIWETDSELRYTFASEGVTKILGYTPHEILGKTPFDLMPKKEVSLVKNRLKEILSLKNPIKNLENWNLSKKGDLICLLTSGIPVLDTTGTFLGYRGIDRDITERKKSEDILDATLSRLKELEDIINRSPLIAILWKNEKDWLAEYVSDNIRLLGYQPADFLSGDVLYVDLIHPDDRRRVLSEIEHHIREGQNQYIQEYRIKNGSGEFIWVRVLTNIRRDENNKITHFQGLVRDIAEQKKLETQLQEISELNKKIVDSALFGIIIYEADSGKAVFANEAAAKIIGATVEQALLQNFKKIESWKKSGLYEAAQKAIQTGKTQHILGSFKTSFEKEISIDCAFQIISHKGRPHLCIIFEDVTQRTKNEKELRLNEKRLRQIIDLVPHFIFAKDTEGQFILVNKAVAQTYGTTVEKLTGKKDADFAKSEEEARHFREDDMSVIDSNQPKLIPEEIITNSQGERRYLETIKIPFTFSGLTEKAVLGVSTDITQRKKAEEALIASEEKYRNIFITTPVSIWEEDFEDVKKFIEDLKSKGIQDLRRYFTKNPEEVKKAADLVKILDVNDATLQMYEAPNKETLLKSLEKVFTPTSFKTFQEELIAIAEGKSFFEAESENKTLLGRTITMLIKLIIPKKEAKYNRITVCIVDITERKRLERIKDDFLNTVSHELRTPLTIIKAGVEVTVSQKIGSINEKQKHMLETAQRNVDRLAHLINDLLDISKMEAGKLNLKKSRFDLVSLFKETLEGFNQLFEEKHLELKTSFPKKPVTVKADPNRITQVFNNLLFNALKFTKEGSIEVSIRTTKSEIVCSIKDSGSGISPENLKRVFQKFEQFSDTGDFKEKGTGLGLAICKNIIELHKGKIWVESVLDKGSKFIFTLPL